MNNKEFFHTFFYSGAAADKHGNLSYAYPCFFSYTTAIGEIAGEKCKISAQNAATLREFLNKTEA